jgi:Ca-activated chloride channel family protein
MIMETTQPTDQLSLFEQNLPLLEKMIDKFLAKNVNLISERDTYLKKAKEILIETIFNYDTDSNIPFIDLIVPKIEEYLNSVLIDIKPVVIGRIDLDCLNSINRPRNTNYKRKISSSHQSGILNFMVSDINLNQFKSKSINKRISVNKQPLSTFSVSVDTASYNWVKKKIISGHLPEKKSVRTEELVNYFEYNYPKPAEGEYIAIAAETGICPWNPKYKLVKIALKSVEINPNQLPPSHLVFLIDVSGSMEGDDRLELVKASLKMLAEKLRLEDSLSIVIFSNNVKVLLNKESGSNKEYIRKTIDKLYASGGTNGEGAIQMAYNIAKDNLIKEGNNRVILCTDGDFNIGINSESGLKKFIKEKAKEEIFLSVFGFGMGNYKDNLAKTLATSGHGNYSYIANLLDANQAMIREFSESMYAVAKDVKVQVEFNPTKVNAYRLIGYETNLLEDEDFNDDQKDAGVMGSGQTVTALFEIVPESEPLIDPLKYQKTKFGKIKSHSDELLTVKVRYKPIGEKTSSKNELAVKENSDSNSNDFRFASAVALFGQLLSNSAYVENSSMEQVIELAKPAINDINPGLRHEFIKLAELAAGLK